MKTPCQLLEVSAWARDALYTGPSEFLRVALCPANTEVHGGTWREVKWETARGYMPANSTRRAIRAQRTGRSSSRYVDLLPLIPTGQAIWLATGKVRERFLAESITACRLQDMTDWRAVQSGALTVQGAQAAPIFILEDILKGQGPHRRRVINAHVPQARAMNPRELYAARWDADHAKGADQWAANPWVWELRIRPLDRRGKSA